MENLISKDILFQNFEKKHLDFIQYIDAINEENFLKNKNDKWNVGQQLEHIVISIKVFTKALISKTFIIENFGYIQRPVFDENTTINNYKKVLANGGKAPERFLPNEVTWQQKPLLFAEIHQYLAILTRNLQQFTDQEIHTLVLPHPLLGNLSISEMFYLLTYHVTHHQNQIIDAQKN